MSTLIRRFEERSCTFCGRRYLPTASRNVHCSDWCRIWSHVDRPSPSACWTWRARRSPLGYGYTSTSKSKSVLVSRLVAEWTIGNPAGMCVLHTCDNPPCVNPGHLRLGTKADNSADMSAKGRSGRQVHPERYPVGSECSHSKLNAQQVRTIRTRVASGERRKDLAAEFGVSKATLAHAVSGRTYRNVQQ